MLPAVPASAGSSARRPEFFGAAIRSWASPATSRRRPSARPCFAPGDVKSTYGTGCFALVNTECDQHRVRQPAYVRYCGRHHPRVPDFQGGSGGASLSSVGPGIAEALTATAAGLFAAIPAAMFYNHFGHLLKEIGSEMDDFSLEFLNLIERSFGD